MNAISFILKEHHKIRKSFAEIGKKSHRYTTKKAMFNALSRYLLRHETMEQTVWYPNFKNSKKIKNEVKHLLSEENHAEKVIKKLKTIKDEIEWEKSFTKFKKAVEQHAQEEEKKLFPNVRDILDKTELEQIGKKMWAFKRKYNKSKH